MKSRKPPMHRQPSKGTAHLAFRIAMMIKGFNGLLELAGGSVLLFVKTATIDHTISILTWDELSRDPDSIIARMLTQLSHHVSVATKDLTIVYLLSHGIVKLVLVVALLTERKSFFVPGLLFLALFILIESIGLIESFSIVLAIVVALDLFIIATVWLEYRRIR